MLRAILQRIFVAVREAANGLEAVWGQDARNRPGFREALIESAVCINAAQAAYTLHLEVERAGKWEIEVLYGVYNLYTNPRDFKTLALQIAEALKPMADNPPAESPPPLDGFESGHGADAQH
jgi:carbonic anhydrase